ncbi:MAG: MG2 domain-containing protein [Treponema sp.]|nr:MG2 domain-containing protein [Treponema sp.]
MRNVSHFWNRIIYILAIVFLIPAGVFAQNEPSGGDEPLKTGEAVILQEQAPAARSSSDTQRVFLRTAILPMSDPEAPVRILFEKPVDITALSRNPDRLYYSIRRNNSTLRGSWNWITNRELQFTPSEKMDIKDYIYVSVIGRVPLAENGSWIDVSVERYFYVENFQMGTKTGSEPVVPGSPRFIAFLNSGTRLIGTNPVYLLYDQPVSRDALFLVSADTGAGPLDVRVTIPQSLVVDPDGLYDARNVIAIEFTELPPDMALIKIRYPLIAVSGTDGFAESAFPVFTDFSWSSGDLDRLKNGSAARLDNNNWTLNFNSVVDSQSFRDAFSITPQPLSLRLSFSTSSSGGSTVEIYARFDIGRVYSVRLADKFTDVLGNSLKNPLAFAFKSQDLASVFLLPAQALVLETGTNRVPAKYRNLRAININVLKFDEPGAYIRSLVSGYSGTGAKQSGNAITVQPNPNGINNLYNADFGIDTGAGLKLLDISATARGSEAGNPVMKQLLVQTTNLGISAKVSDSAVFCWITAINNGVSQPGAKVSIYDSDGKVIAEGGTTDRNGTITIKTSAAKAGRLDADIYVAARYSGDMAICRLANNEMSNAWQFNLPGAVSGVNPLSAALFTERGAYRPGESVYYKTFVRDLPEYAGINQVKLEVKDSRGRDIYSNSKNLDSYRGAAWEIKLDDNAPVGEYTAALTLGSFTTRGSFQVEEYRVPAFQVNVTGLDTEWKIENNFVAACSAEYLRGGVLSGKNVSWRVYRQSEDFTTSAFPAYVFNLDRDPGNAGTVLDEQGVTDSSGKSQISFRPSFPDGWGPMRYIVQASVTDDDRQTYAGRLSGVVHGAELYAGVRPPNKNIFRSGEKINFTYIVTDTAGSVRPGQNVTLYIDTFSYNQNTMLDDEGRTSTYNRQVITSSLVSSSVSASSPQELIYTPDRAGFYRLRLEVKDRNNRISQTGFDFTVSGSNTVAWPRYDRERIDILLDKQSYTIGDTASVVVQTPFENARGLLTIEANGVLDTYPFTIDGNTPRLTFPVRASYLPNAYVSVILLRGRIHYAKDATGFETGAPAYRIGYARLEVNPESQRLSLTLPGSPISASPAQKVDIAFSVRTPDGKPTDASAVVMVVDEGALALTGFTTPDPVRLAYSFRVLAVRNASNLLDLPYSRRSRYEALFPSGDSDEPTLLPRSDDIMRRLFKSTAFYAPAVQVGPDGRGVVSFTLPDNLTTYRVMVIAANKQGQMGQAECALTARRSLAVEPVLPRFVYEEDRFTIQARVFNGTNAVLETTLGSNFKGVEVSGVAAKNISVTGGDSALVSWDGRVLPGADKVTVSFNAAAGSLRDAVEVSIPVRRRGNRQRGIASAFMNPGASLNLLLPPGRSNGVMDISVSDSPLSELKDAIQWLLEYPHGCIEQTTSGTYPLIVLADLLPSIGINIPRDEIKKYAEAGVNRLMTFRTKSGGLSFWPGEENPHAFGTAFGLSALIEAEKRGYSVPKDALDEMANYLEGIIAKKDFTRSMRSYGEADSDTLAFFAMTLGRMGRPQVQLIMNLWENKNTLTPFGFSFLAAAQKEANNAALSRDVPLQDILDEIAKAAVVTNTSATFAGEPIGSWSFDSPTRNNAVALMAYAIAAPDDPLTVKFLRGLLDKRRNGLWDTTQGNVFGIMAIYYLVSGTPDSPGKQESKNAPGEFAVVIDGKRFAASQFTRAAGGPYTLQVRESELPSVDNRNIQIESDRQSPKYVNVRSVYDMPFNAAFLAPKTSGLTYRRTFETIEGRALGGEIALGSLVRVRLTIANNADRYYMIIEDLLPAGFEALNTNLLTTQAVDQSGESGLAKSSRAVISHQDFGDYRAAFYADELKAGNYEFVYYARATTAGTFFLPISLAEAMYDPDSYGTTGGGTLIIK